MEFYDGEIEVGEEVNNCEELKHIQNLSDEVKNCLIHIITHNYPKEEEFYVDRMTKHCYFLLSKYVKYWGKVRKSLMIRSMYHLLDEIVVLRILSYIEINLLLSTIRKPGNFTELGKDEVYKQVFGYFIKDHTRKIYRIFEKYRYDLDNHRPYVKFVTHVNFHSSKVSYEKSVFSQFAFPKLTKLVLRLSSSDFVDLCKAPARFLFNLKSFDLNISLYIITVSFDHRSPVRSPDEHWKSEVVEKGIDQDFFDSLKVKAPSLVSFRFGLGGRFNVFETDTHSTLKGKVYLIKRINLCDKVRKVVLQKLSLDFDLEKCSKNVETLSLYDLYYVNNVFMNSLKRLKHLRTLFLDFCHISPMICRENLKVVPDLFFAREGLENLERLSIIHGLESTIDMENLPPILQEKSEEHEVQFEHSKLYLKKLNNLDITRISSENEFNCFKMYLLPPQITILSITFGLCALAATGYVTRTQTIDFSAEEFPNLKDLTLQLFNHRSTDYFPNLVFDNVHITMNLPNLTDLVIGSVTNVIIQPQFTLNLPKLESFCIRSSIIERDGFSKAINHKSCPSLKIFTFRNVIIEELNFIFEHPGVEKIDISEKIRCEPKEFDPQIPDNSNLRELVIYFPDENAYTTFLPKIFSVAGKLPNLERFLIKDATYGKQEILEKNYFSVLKSFIFSDRGEYEIIPEELSEDELDEERKRLKKPGLFRKLQKFDWKSVGSTVFSNYVSLFRVMKKIRNNCNKDKTRSSKECDDDISEVVKIGRRLNELCDCSKCSNLEQLGYISLFNDMIEQIRDRQTTFQDSFGKVFDFVKPTHYLTKEGSFKEIEFMRQFQCPFPSIPIEVLYYEIIPFLDIHGLWRAMRICKDLEYMIKKIIERRITIKHYEKRISWKKNFVEYEEIRINKKKDVTVPPTRSLDKLVWYDDNESDFKLKYRKKGSDHSFVISLLQVGNLVLTLKPNGMPVVPTLDRVMKYLEIALSVIEHSEIEVTKYLICFIHFYDRDNFIENVTFTITSEKKRHQYLKSLESDIIQLFLFHGANIFLPVERNIVVHDFYRRDDKLVSVFEYCVWKNKRFFLKEFVDFFNAFGHLDQFSNQTKKEEHQSRIETFFSINFSRFFINKKSKRFLCTLFPNLETRKCFFWICGGSELLTRAIFHNFLFLLIEKRESKLIKLLLQKNNLICEIMKNVRDEDGNNMLIHACRIKGKMMKILEEILKYFDVNECKNNFGETPLYHAVECRNIETIRLLDFKGAEWVTNCVSERTEKSPRDILEEDVILKRKLVDLFLK